VLIRDAVLRFDDAPDATELSVQLMSFINRYKDGAAQA
jgi:hypothetical protein